MLFSRSGYLRWTQSEHFFGAALAIKDINERGGVLGRPIEVVAYDPQSEPGMYRDLANRLLVEDGVSVIFGCSSSAERKAVLASIERRNGLLWYPSFYEGFEYSPNVLYTGACPNQNSFPLANFIVEKLSKRVFFVGADYVYPRETNRIMRDLIETQGGIVVGEVYGVPTGDEPWIRRTVGEIARLAGEGPLTVFSTLVGTPSHTFYRLLHAEGLPARGVAVTSLTLAEGEVREIGAEVCAGHITAATYFASLPGSLNDRFRGGFAAEYGTRATPSLWSASTYAQVLLFAAALERCGTLDTQRLVDAAQGLSSDAPEGPIRIDPDNNHVWLTPRIARVREDGGFEILWRSREPVRPDPYLSTTSFRAKWIDTMGEA